MVDVYKKFRHELKYYIHEHDYLNLRTRVNHLLELDKNSQSAEGYHIRSLYLDNVYESALHDKTNGIYARKKYRIRIYNHNDYVIKLERKSKINQYVLKESVTLTREQYEKIMIGDLSDFRNSSNPLVQDFYIDMNTGIMRPAVIVDYIREAYIHPLTDTRITFDKQLCAGIQSLDLFNPRIETYEMLSNGVTILEVKYTRFLPSMISDVLQISAHNRSAISKYTICKESRKAYTF